MGGHASIRLLNELTSLHHLSVSGSRRREDREERVEDILFPKLRLVEE